VGRYFFFAMMFSAGMWSASVCKSTSRSPVSFYNHDTVSTARVTLRTLRERLTQSIPPIIVCNVHHHARLFTLVPSIHLDAHRYLTGIQSHRVLRPRCNPGLAIQCNPGCALPARTTVYDWWANRCRAGERGAQVQEVGYGRQGYHLECDYRCKSKATYLVSRPPLFPCPHSQTRASRAPYTHLSYVLS
jgi:hypothetical protein